MLDIEFQIIFGKIFKPLAWLMGVHWSECEDVGTLIGLKIFTSELLGFIDLGELSNKNVLSVRAKNKICKKMYSIFNDKIYGILC